MAIAQRDTYFEVACGGLKLREDALFQGGPEALGEVLAEWYGVEDGQLCEGPQSNHQRDEWHPRWPLARRIEEKGAGHSFNDRRFPNAADIL